MQTELKHCRQCGKPIGQWKAKHAEFCSYRCQKDKANIKWKELNPSYPGVARNSVGAAHELLVCCDLLLKGHSVFRSVSPSASCDLAVLVNDKLCRVEVTTSYRTPKGVTYPNSKKDERHKFDVLALVLRTREIIYVPTIEEWAKGTGNGGIDK